MLEMAILETHIFKTFWGSMPPDPPRKLAPLALVVPPPPLKVLDLLEISHTQQFFNLGISAGMAQVKRVLTNQVKNWEKPIQNPLVLFLHIWLFFIKNKYISCT